MALILIAIGAGSLRAQGLDQNPEVLELLRRPGELTLRETTLTQALFTISESWQVNVVVGNEVEGQVNGIFRDAPLHEILDSILTANGYGYQIVGSSLVVKPIKDLPKIDPMFTRATIQLQHADPAQLVESTRLIGSPRARIEAIPSARSLLVLDFPDRVKLIREFVAQLDNSAGANGPITTTNAGVFVEQYSPQFIPVKSLKTAVESLLSEEGKVALLEDRDRIVVFDRQANLRMIGSVIAKLDKPQPQVRITAMIYDVSLEDIERLGINWGSNGKWRHDGNDDPQGQLGIDSLLMVPAAAGSPAGTITMANLSRHFDLTAVLDLLQQCDDARLLANPTITCIDRDQAKIEIITEIPYQQLTETAEGGNIGTTGFREAGVTLQVSPRIAADGTIIMQVTPSFSRLTGFTDGAQAQPIIDTRRAQTTVRVSDQQTLVIGGLRQRTDVGSFSGIPGLKDLKHIGKFFRARDTSIRESELVVFITPEIIQPQQIGLEREVEALEHGRSLLDGVPTARALDEPWIYDHEDHRIRTRNRHVPPAEVIDPACQAKPECTTDIHSRFRHKTRSHPNTIRSHPNTIRCHLDLKWASTEGQGQHIRTRHRLPNVDPLQAAIRLLVMVMPRGGNHPP